jgi:hypothetical protein
MSLPFDQQKTQSGNSIFENIYAHGSIETPKIKATSVPGIEGISEGILAASKNRIFVSTAGDDNNSGLSADDPVLTIKRAAEIATTNFEDTDKKSIYVSSGEYVEQNPIVLPRFCAIIGDSLRTVVLRPGIPDVDYFKVKEGDMLMNLVFRDNDGGDFTFRYAMSYDNSGSKLIINQSPYALNCSLISTRGRGKNTYSIVANQWTKGSSQEPRGSFAYVDGNAVDSISSGDSSGGNLESMVFALLSIITPGIGIHIDNCAYAQIVNVFGIFNTDNILCENGGYASVTNSATNFGINALRSVGYSPVTNVYSQDTGIISFACASSTGAGSTDRITIAGAATTIAGSQSIVTIVDNANGDELQKPNINNLLRFGYGTGETNFTHSGTEFQIRKVSDSKTITYGGESRTAYDVAISPRLDEHFSGSYTQYSSFNNISVRQLRPSVVNSSSHTWEYAGSGTNYDALPKNGGFTRVENEQVEEDYGQVYTSGTNELGDFKVGNFVVLKNNTGEVQFTTPIPIAQIDRINFTSGNTNLIITGAVNDTQMGGSAPSDNFIPTQRAVNVFVSSGTTSVTNKTITLGGNTITGTTAQFNAALTDNDFATLAGSEVLTNKSISGAANTFTNIPNSALSNSTISGISLGSNLNSLSLGVSGTGLSGSATYNGSSGQTFTVTSNATSSNTGSTIVSRDSSGNFSAGTITATSAIFSGNVSIGGTLTYEDVTNIDSVGLVTARTGVRITSGGLIVTSGVSTFTSDIKLSGAVRDRNDGTGSSGQILASTGSNTVEWISQSSAAVGAATSVSITSENTDASRKITFVGNTSGIDNIRVDTDLTYNPSSNTLSAGTFSGSGASLSSLNASNLSSGTVGVDRLGTSGTRDSTTFLRGDNTWQEVKQTFDVVAKTNAYILAASDVGSIISITTGGVTVPSGTFTAGDTVLIYNNSASSQTITQGASTTLRLPGTSDTGNRTLQQRGLATVLCVASNEFLITGSGLL